MYDFAQVTKRAIESAGGTRAVALARGISKTAVWYWINKTGRIPVEHVADMERLSGIPRSQLRPDVFGEKI